MRKSIFLPALFAIVCFCSFPIFGENPPKTLSVVLKHVRELLQKKDYSAAISEIEKELKDNSGEYQLWLALGYSNECMNNTEKALEAFKKAGSLKNGLKGLDSKIATLDKRLKERNSDAKSLFKQALKEKSNGNFDKAFPLFIECVENDPTILEDDEGMVETGLNFYKQKMKDRENSTPLYFSIFQFFKGYPDESILGLKKFLSSNPEKELASKAEKWVKKIEEFKKVQIAAAVSPIAIPTNPAPKKVLDKRPPSRVIETASLPTQTIPSTGSYTPSLEMSPSTEFKNSTADEIFDKAMEFKAENRPIKAINILSEAVAKKNDPKMSLELGNLYLSIAPKENAKIAIKIFRDVASKFPNSKESREAKSKLLSFQSPVMERSREVEEYFLSHDSSSE